MTIYGDTLTVPKPIYGIDSEKELLTLDSFKIERLGFEKREEGVEKILMEYAPYGNNNVVAMMMMTVAPIVTTTIEVMIALIVVMIGVNPLVIEKMKMQTYSMRNMIVMWTIMMKT